MNQLIQQFGKYNYTTTRHFINIYVDAKTGRTWFWQYDHFGRENTLLNLGDI